MVWCVCGGCGVGFWVGYCVVVVKVLNELGLIICFVIFDFDWVVVVYDVCVVVGWLVLCFDYGCVGVVYGNVFGGGSLVGWDLCWVVWVVGYCLVCVYLGCLVLSDSVDFCVFD